MSTHYPVYQFIRKQNYALLLLALVAHLFCGVFTPNNLEVGRYIFAFFTSIVCLCSINISFRKSKREIALITLFFCFIISIPLLYEYIENIALFRHYFSIPYALFFLFIFSEILRFLFRPKEITHDLILAASSGYLVLVEIFVFIMEFHINRNPGGIHGINLENPLTILTDLVYFCSITISGIGYGDIHPLSSEIKLTAAFMGICGQFYLVVLVGIIISKFSNSRG